MQRYICWKRTRCDFLIFPRCNGIRGLSEAISRDSKPEVYADIYAPSCRYSYVLPSNAFSLWRDICIGIGMNRPVPSYVYAHLYFFKISLPVILQLISLRTNIAQDVYTIFSLAISHLFHKIQNPKRGFIIFHLPTLIEFLPNAAFKFEIISQSIWLVRRRDRQPVLST